MFDWGNIFSHILVFVLGAVGGVLSQLANVVVKPIIERIEDGLRVPRETFKIPISANYNDLTSRAQFRFMLVRYASDSVYNRLEGAQRTEARLQNRLFPVKLTEVPEPDKAMLIFRLPVHPTLGTQFKLYAIPKTPADIEPLKEQLSSVEEIALTDPSAGGEQWFLLKKEYFPRITTVDTDPSGIKNNYVGPDVSK